MGGHSFPRDGFIPEGAHTRACLSHPPHAHDSTSWAPTWQELKKEGSMTCLAGAQGQITHSCEQKCAQFLTPLSPWALGSDFAALMER